ncbi:hypothetical protein CVT26_013061 [Gymnopilus dilepis]|uniref:Uncharacterized protein n=1 Tax=Gymnopilus dilepis TaxID=231916 RepID=A0A409Y4D5_9AGAR|nr:hypothetical protein CVT26_013061 [Gymnopilus dilepis]
MDAAPSGSSGPPQWSQLAFHPIGLEDLGKRLRYPVDNQILDIYKDRFDAANLAWFACGHSSKDTHIKKKEMHQEFNVFSRATQPNGAKIRRDVRDKLRTLTFDCAALLDKAFGGSTLVIHVPGTTRPGSAKEVDFVKVDCYFPAHMARENPTCATAIDSIIQRFIRDVGLPTISRFESCTSQDWMRNKDKAFVPPPPYDPDLEAAGTSLSACSVSQHVGRRQALDPSPRVDEEPASTSLGQRRGVDAKQNTTMIALKQRIEQLETSLADSHRREQELLREVHRLSGSPGSRSIPQPPTPSTPGRRCDVNVHMQSPIRQNTGSPTISDSPYESLHSLRQLRARTAPSQNRRGSDIPSPSTSSGVPATADFVQTQGSAKIYAFLGVHGLDRHAATVDAIREVIPEDKWQERLLLAGIPAELLEQLLSLMSSASLAPGVSALDLNYEIV